MLAFVCACVRACALDASRCAPRPQQTSGTSCGQVQQQTGASARRVRVRGTKVWAHAAVGHLARWYPLPAGGALAWTPGAPCCPVACRVVLLPAHVGGASARGAGVRAGRARARGESNIRVHPRRQCPCTRSRMRTTRYIPAATHLCLAHPPVRPPSPPPGTHRGPRVAARPATRNNSRALWPAEMRPECDARAACLRAHVRTAHSDASGTCM